MNLKHEILKHHELNNFEENFLTLDYAYSDYDLFIKEIKALNGDNTFLYTLELTAHNTVRYLYFPNKEAESIGFSEVITYIDRLKNKLIELDQADKLGHCSRVKDEYYSDTIRIDGLYTSGGFKIEVEDSEMYNRLKQMNR